MNGQRNYKPNINQIEYKPKQYESTRPRNCNGC